MATSTRTDDPTNAAIVTLGQLAEDAYSDQGVASAGTRVWSGAVPNNVDLPYAVIGVRQTPSTLAGTKDDEPVSLNGTVRFHDTDEFRCREVAVRYQEKATERNPKPSFSGFVLIWHDLVFHQELNEIRDSQPNIYGRVVECIYHLEIA